MRQRPYRVPEAISPAGMITRRLIPNTTSTTTTSMSRPSANEEGLKPDSLTCFVVGVEQHLHGPRDPPQSHRSSTTVGLRA